MANYREYLLKAGPDGGPLTVTQLVFRIEVLQDDWWLEHLCIDEAEAAKALVMYQDQLAKMVA